MMMMMMMMMMMKCSVDAADDPINYGPK